MRSLPQQRRAAAALRLFFLLLAMLLPAGCMQKPEYRVAENAIQARITRQLLPTATADTQAHCQDALSARLYYIAYQAGVPGLYACDAAGGQALPAYLFPSLAGQYAIAGLTADAQGGGWLCALIPMRRVRCRG